MFQPAAKARDIPTVLKVTDFLLDRLPAVFAKGVAVKTLLILLRLITPVAQRHRSDWWGEWPAFHTQHGDSWDQSSCKQERVRSFPQRTDSLCSCLTSTSGTWQTKWRA